MLPLNVIVNNMKLFSNLRFSNVVLLGRSVMLPCHGRQSFSQLCYVHIYSYAIFFLFPSPTLHEERLIQLYLRI